MQWSKLKRHIEERFADSLRDRVALHDTWYRHAGRDRDGRVWLTVDGQEIANFCDFRYWNAARPVIERARGFDLNFPYDAARETLNADGVFTRSDAHEALHESLSLSVNDMLHSASGIVRALAMLDRRLGKRRLAHFALASDEIPLVRGCFALRYEAESITPPVEGGYRIGAPERFSKESIAQRVERKRRFYEGISAISARRRDDLITQFTAETSNPEKSLGATAVSVE